VQKSGRKKGYNEAGLCIRCGGERVEGRKLCADCLEKQRESMAYARQFAVRNNAFTKGIPT
jgi:NMD protein affecting ribosome stability and mRNA decay